MWIPCVRLFYFFNSDDTIVASIQDEHWNFVTDRQGGERL